MSKTDELIGSVQDQLGPDAYNIYPDSRRLIPDAVLWGIAAACLIEFLKGLGGFNDLGKQARERLEEMIRRWKTHKDFEPYVQTLSLELRADVADALSSITNKEYSRKEYDDSRVALTESLIQFGLHPKTAQQHAGVISDLVLDANKHDG